jgi:hypothetical protein
MSLKPQKSIREVSITIFKNFGYDGGCIVKPYAIWNTIDMFKYGLSAFKKAFLVFSLKQLKIALIAIWK